MKYSLNSMPKTMKRSFPKPPADWKPATEEQIRAGTTGGANMTAEAIKRAQTYAPRKLMGGMKSATSTPMPKMAKLAPVPMPKRMPLPASPERMPIPIKKLAAKISRGR